MESKKEKSDLIRISDAEKMTGFSRSKITTAVINQELQSVRIGGVVFLSEKAVTAWLVGK